MPSFLRGDFFDRMAEKIFVIEINRRDDRDFRFDDIGGVEAAAEADFVNGKIHEVLCESKKGQSRNALEESWMRSELSTGHQRFDGGMNARPGRGEIMVRNIFAVDADAFVDAFQVRRSVEAGAQPGGAQDGFEHRGCGTFAVGPGDVHAG